MTKKILLTSFTTWQSHQKSNSSDDLLIEIAKNPDKNSELATSPSLTFLRQLPVDIQQASNRAIAEIDTLKPDLIICCGMAERREKLSIESNASCDDHIIETWIDIYKLLPKLNGTEISHDAGKFVCEGLYYSTLNYLRDRHPNSRCIFVHVPLLTPHNSAEIKADFCQIIDLLALSS